MIVDLNSDSHPDIFVANDGDRNLLFQNQGDWGFQEIALVAGVAYNSKGRSMGSMGIASADFTGDGAFDLLTTNFSGERNVLFQNIGEMLFLDNSLNTPIDYTSRPLVGWSAIPIDVDYDGHMDLFVSNGHVTEMPDEEFRQSPLLMRGLPDGKWEAAQAAGEYFLESWHGRGAAKADFNGDYYSDLVVSHISNPPSILLNRSGDPGNRIAISLIGTISNRNAINTSVSFKSDERVNNYQISLNNGYLCSEPGLLVIGLGAAESVSNLTIEWPSGKNIVIPTVLANTKIVIVEDGVIHTSILPN